MLANSSHNLTLIFLQPKYYITEYILVYSKQHVNSIVGLNTNKRRGRSGISWMYFVSELSQLTDVEAGGVTAFNLVGARVVPEKVYSMHWSRCLSPLCNLRAETWFSSLRTKIVKTYQGMLCEGHWPEIVTRKTIAFKLNSFKFGNATGWKVLTLLATYFVTQIRCGEMFVKLCRHGKRRSCSYFEFCQKTSKYVENSAKTKKAKPAKTGSHSLHAYAWKKTATDVKKTGT